MSKTLFAVLCVLVAFFSTNSAQAKSWLDDPEIKTLAESKFGDSLACLEELRVATYSMDLTSGSEAVQIAVKAEQCQKKAKSAYTTAVAEEKASAEQCRVVSRDWPNTEIGFGEAYRACEKKFPASSKNAENNLRECRERALFAAQDRQREEQKRLLPEKTRCDTLILTVAVTASIVKEFPPFSVKAIGKLSYIEIASFRRRYLSFLPRKLSLPTGGDELEEIARKFYPSFFSEPAPGLDKLIKDSEYLILHREEMLLGYCQQLRETKSYGSRGDIKSVQGVYNDSVLHLLALRWIREVYPAKLGYIEPWPDEYPFLFSGLKDTTCSAQR